VIFSAIAALFGFLERILQTSLGSGRTKLPRELKKKLNNAVKERIMMIYLTIYPYLDVVLMLMKTIAKNDPTALRINN
jgi:hypothetical protein